MRRRFADFEEPAPQGLWDQIEKRVEHKRNVAARQHTIKMWSLRAVAAAAIITLVVVMSNRIFDADFQENKQSVAKGSASRAVPRIEEQDNKLTAQNAAQDNSVLESKQMGVKRSTLGIRLKNDTFPLLTMVGKSNSIEKENSTSEEPSSAQENTNEEKQGESILPKRSHKENRPLFEVEEPVKQSTSRRFMLNLFASNIPAANANKQGIGQDVDISYNGGGIFPGGGGNTVVDPLTDMLVFNEKQPVETKSHHRQPIRFGFTVSYPLTSRWAIESGVTYSYLSAHITFGSETYWSDTQQKLHYVGIPLKANFNLLKFNHFNLYLSAGGCVEMCVAGRSSVDYIADGNVLASENNNTRPERLQWSVNAAAGAQYDLTKNWALFVQPGMAYYFDNGGTIETIYQKQPFNFDLSLGLRLSLE